MNFKKFALGLVIFTSVAFLATTRAYGEEIDVIYTDFNEISDITLSQMLENNENIANENPVVINETENQITQVGNPSELAQSVVQKALSLQGIPYVFGASGPNSFDCSGFTSYVMAAHGISIPRVASSQAYGGTGVDRANLQEGDLVFFNTYGSLSHTGIYIGGGQFVHASSSGRGVVVDSLNNPYYSQRYACASRYI